MDSRPRSYSYDLNGNRTGTGYSTVTNEQTASPGIHVHLRQCRQHDLRDEYLNPRDNNYTYDYRNRLTEVTPAVRSWLHTRTTP